MAVARADGAVAKGVEVVSGQAQVVIAFALNVVKEQPINWDAPVMSSHVPSAERS